ncbi:unnamed protein product [Symbiodinium sp. CCMP2456]|nr:unnamed protein product [Symbiodinium sp. CCMP2456]
MAQEWQGTDDLPPVPDDEEGLGSEEAEAEAYRDEYEDFRRWLRQRDRGGGRYERRPRTRTTRREDEDEEDGPDDFWTNAGPPPSWDGVQCPFEDYLIRARIWISTTKARARTRGPLLLKALSETPFQDFKHLAKDPAWLADQGNAETLLKKMDSPEYYGDDQEEHLLASLARVTYHLKRQKNETARQFLGRWEAAERKVQEHKVALPSLYRGFLMINALGLTDGEIKMLLTFTHGSIEPKDIKTWLRKHETKLQAGQLGNETTAKGKSSTAAVHSVEHTADGSAELSEGEEELETMEAMLADLADEEDTGADPGVFEEEEAAEILAMMIKEKKKTYTQSAQIKKDKELGRGYRQGGRQFGHHDRSGPIRPGTYKLSIAELKQRTRCKRCNKVGHWHKECTNPPAPGHTRDPKETHLLEIDLEHYDDALFCHHLEAGPADDFLEESSAEHDILSQSVEPSGYGKGHHSRNAPFLLSLKFLMQSEAVISLRRGHLMLHLTRHGAQIPLHVGPLRTFQVALLAMDCSSPTNKRAREQPNQERAHVIYIAWQRLVLKVAMFLRPVARLAVQVFSNSVEASLNHVKAHLKDINPEELVSLRKDVDQILMEHKDQEYDLFMKFREWKKSKKSSAASGSRPDSYVLVKNEPDKMSEASRYTFDSGYTHFNCRTGSRGRRLSTPSPASQPREPPPPQPVTDTDVSMKSGQTADSTAIKINAELHAIVTDKHAQQEIFTQAYHILEPNHPLCYCRHGCKVELSATTQNPSRVFYNCRAKEPTQQCGFFQWADVQPLLDDKFEETRRRVAEGFPRDLSPRELLVKILQDACPHFSKVGTGSNAFYKRERCRMCSKLLSVESRQKTVEIAEETDKESELESHDATEYQAYLQWKKERY